MDLQTKHNYIRQKLDLLGYQDHQSLPVSSLPLVSTILDDLISTTEGLKKAKDEISLLLEEKCAWNLGVEVYKCDNSKLLSECNKLKIELLNNERSSSIENADLKRKIRNLDADKKYLEEKCHQLTSTIYQYNHGDKLKSKSANFKPEKPFISTVKSNATLPDPAFSSGIKNKCNCAASVTNFKKSGIFKEIEKLKSDLQFSEDVIVLLKKQESDKEREIQRLNCLFAGGRPVSALAKDCCYKDVSKISEDISILQRDKVELQMKLNDSLNKQEKMSLKFKQIKDKNSQLEAYIKEISDAALYVEREANLKIKNQNRDISELKEGIAKGSIDLKSSEMRNIKKVLKEKCLLEKKLVFEIEYLKNKLNEYGSNISLKNSDLVADLTKDRDFYQNKYKSMLEKRERSLDQGDDNDIHKFYRQLKDKEFLITKLQDEIKELREEQMSPTTNRQQHESLAMTNTIRRVENDRDCALKKLETLNIDYEAQNDKLRMWNDSKINDSKKIIALEDTIVKLRVEIEDLQTSKTPAFQTIKSLREDNCELQIKLRTADEDYKKLNTTYNQLKLLSQQTESILMNVQNQLEFTKCELLDKESQICRLSKTNECSQQQIDKLNGEIGILKTIKGNVEREKDFYMMTLDKKCEKIHSFESKMESNTQLKDSLRILKAQNDDLTCELKRMESIVCDTRNENQCLCKQLDSNKNHLTNAIHENGRMADELGSITVELNLTKKCLHESQKESENIRKKLQSYIHEIERVDGLIAIKDNERKMAMLQSKDLECCNIKLQQKYHCLDQESFETKKTISEYQERVDMCHEEVRSRELDIESMEKQLMDLSQEIEMLRDKNCKLNIDLSAQRNLCDKLDIQKMKQDAELNEYQLSVKELLEKNDKLREEIQRLRENGAGGDTHISSSYHPTM